MARATRPRQSSARGSLAVVRRGMTSWRVDDARALATAIRDVARALDEATEGRDGDAFLSSVKGTALAGNVAEGLRRALENVREHAGEAFVDVDATRRSTRRAMRAEGEGEDDDLEASDGRDEEAFEDMFDAEGKPRRGGLPRRGHTLPGMSDAIGELRGVLKKVGVKSAHDDSPNVAEEAASSGAEADGEASEVEASAGERRAALPVAESAPPPKAEKPQWMIELAAKNAAKRAQQNANA